MCVAINHYSIENISSIAELQWKAVSLYILVAHNCIIITQTCDLPVSTLFVMRVVHVLIQKWDWS